MLFAPAAAPNVIVWTSIPNIGVARGTQSIQFVSRTDLPKYESLGMTTDNGIWNAFRVFLLKS